MLAHNLPSNSKNKPRMRLLLENQRIPNNLRYAGVPDPQPEQLDLPMNEIKRLTELAKNLPDIRKDKIRVIKKRTESGKYKISPEKVTESIVELYKQTRFI